MNDPVSGYARIVRLGPSIYVSGTTSADAHGRIRALGDARAQMLFALQNLDIALSTVGADRTRVVELRALLTDAKHSPDVQAACREYYGNDAPPLLCLPAPLADPAVLVEVEADAVL